MQPKNHPIEKEHHLPTCHFGGSMLRVFFLPKYLFFHGTGQGEGDQALNRRYLERPIEQWK